MFAELFEVIIMEKRRTIKKKSVKSGRKNNMLRMFSVIAVIIAVIIFIVITNTSRVDTQAVPQIGEKHYKSIMVERGDTLWSIAADNLSDGQNDINALVKEIMDINGLDREVITYGANLIVPYYGD